MNPRAGLVLLFLAAAPGVAAQDLGQRVAATADGTVRFAFAVRKGVEICTQGIRIHGDAMMWREDRARGREDICRTDLARVEVDLSDGLVRRVNVLRAGEEGAAGARDLGEVPASEAAGYFLGLARRGSAERGARDAIFPAVLADVPEVWRDILVLARERDVPARVRTNAVFWLGQEAASSATAGLAAVAFDNDDEQSVRDAAVFALSQRPDQEGVPVLMELARTAEQSKTRRTAFFWLAQSKDPRVLPFFEDVLLGRSGG